MIEMNPQPTTTFCLPKWSLYVLLTLFIFSPGTPSSATQQKVPVQTERRDEPRSGKKLFHFGKIYQRVSQNSFTSETSLFTSLLQYSNSIEVCFKNRDDLILLFASIDINLIANFLPRSSEESFF